MEVSEKEIIQVLQFIVKKMTDKDIVRRLDGGIVLMIRGIPRHPRDIDIRTDKKGYEKFREIFLSMKKDELYDEEKKKHYIIFDIQGREVEVAYYEKERENMDMFEYIIQKNRNNITIPVLSLKEMRQFYERIGSTEKVQLIENFLNKIL